MKYFFNYLIISFGLLIFSCSENNELNSPDLNKAQSNPTGLDTISDEIFSVSNKINGVVGGEILLDTSLVNIFGELVNVNARLKIDSNSFFGTYDIRMVPDLENASIQFHPHLIFDKPLKLSLTYTGINLTRLGYTWNTKANFVYISDNGTVEQVKFGFCTINWPQQKLTVSNAKLDHFSRYSFIR